MSRALTTKDLCVGYLVSRRQVPVLSDVTASARPGELTALIGQNGSGKSTLLRTVTRLQPALSGAISLDGRPLHGYHRTALAQRVAVVLTDRVGVDHLRVRDLVTLGRHPHLGLAGTLRPLDHRRVDEALETAGATLLVDRLLSSLSDGQRQRVFIARALAQEPDVLVCDEPTSFLDPAGRISILALLRGLAQQHGTAVLVSTHEVELALRYADRLWVAADGRLTEGEPATLAHDGTIGKAFAARGVSFCAERMAFVEDAGAAYA